MSRTLRVDVGDLAPGEKRAVEEGETKILVCNVDGAYYAIENQCPHAAVRLDAGALSGAVLECPVHGGKLDVRDGSPQAQPIRRPVATYPVREQDGAVEIQLD